MIPGVVSGFSPPQTVRKSGQEEKIPEKEKPQNTLSQRGRTGVFELSVPAGTKKPRRAEAHMYAHLVEF